MARKLSPDAPSVARCRRAASRIWRVIGAGPLAGGPQHRGPVLPGGLAHDHILLNAMGSNVCEHCS